MNDRPLANVNRLLSASLALLMGAFVPGANAAQPSPPFAADACGYVRGATGCTAEDIDIVSLTLDNLQTNPTSCNAGETITIYVNVGIQSNATNRYNVGLLFAKDGATSRSPWTAPALAPTPATR